MNVSPGQFLDICLELKLSGNPQATLTRETGKLTVDLGLFPLRSILILRIPTEISFSTLPCLQWITKILPG